MPAGQTSAMNRLITWPGGEELRIAEIAEMRQREHVARNYAETCLRRGRRGTTCSKKAQPISMRAMNPFATCGSASCSAASSGRS